MRYPPTKCPYCGYKIDGHAPIGSNDTSRPVTGAVAICINCGDFSMFEIVLRKPTPEEHKELEVELKGRSCRSESVCPKKKEGSELMSSFDMILSRDPIKPKIVAALKAKHGCRKVTEVRHEGNRIFSGRCFVSDASYKKSHTTWLFLGVLTVEEGKDFQR